MVRILPLKHNLDMLTRCISSAALLKACAGCSCNQMVNRTQNTPLVQTQLIIEVYFLHSVLPCTSATESTLHIAHCGGPQTELGRPFLSRSYFFFQGFQYALIPPTYSKKESSLFTTIPAGITVRGKVFWG